MMALSTDYVLRCGSFPMMGEGKAYVPEAIFQETARRRYGEVKKRSVGGKERIVGGWDVFC